MDEPIPMRLPCPECGDLHIDEGEFATKPHHTHSCQRCGLIWRPALVATVGVRFLPGFKSTEVLEALWENVLPHGLEVCCDYCGATSNAPAVHGFVFDLGKWWCRTHGEMNHG